MDGQNKNAIRDALLEAGKEPELAEQLAAHKAITGNKPSTIITMTKLTPSTLGSLIALYEHKVFCSSAIWNINAFYQWGVDLGKSISSQIYNSLQEGKTDASNPATAAAIKEYIHNKNTD